MGHPHGKADGGGPARFKSCRHAKVGAGPGLVILFQIVESVDIVVPESGSNVEHRRWHFAMVVERHRGPAEIQRGPGTVGGVLGDQRARCREGKTVNRRLADQPERQHGDVGNIGTAGWNRKVVITDDLKPVLDPERQKYPAVLRQDGRGRQERAGGADTAKGKASAAHDPITRRACAAG